MGQRITPEMLHFFLSLNDTKVRRLIVAASLEPNISVLEVENVKVHHSSFLLQQQHTIPIIFENSFLPNQVLNMSKLHYYNRCNKNKMY